LRWSSAVGVRRGLVAEAAVGAMRWSRHSANLSFNGRAASAERRSFDAP
jgi:hypothetical protein